MFDAIFSSFGPLGSALALLAIVAPVFAIAAVETLRLARPTWPGSLLERAGGLGRLRPWIAGSSERGDSPRPDAWRGPSGVSVRVRSVWGRLGAGAAAQRRSR
ncbi:MAG: hypothetical protein AMXMBFR56_19990 [Polyangiaceae bacterium]